MIEENLRSHFNATGTSLHHRLHRSQAHPQDRHRQGDPPGGVPGAVRGFRRPGGFR